MPDDTFHREFVALIEAREWPDKPPEAIDHDVQFMIFTCLEIYMSGRRPPPPRPNSPGLLFGLYGLCSLRDQNLDVENPNITG